MEDSMGVKSPRFHFSLATLLWVTTVAGVWSSFLKIAGAESCISVLGSAMTLPVGVWVVCWLLTTTRGKVRFGPVFFSALLGTASGGILGIYAMGIDVSQLNLMEHVKFHTSETHTFQTWTGWGGLLGVVFGAFLSWRSSHVAPPLSTSEEDQGA